MWFHLIDLFFNSPLLLLEADGTCVIFLSLMKDTMDTWSSGSIESFKNWNTEVFQQFFIYNVGLSNHYNVKGDTLTAIIYTSLEQKTAQGEVNSQYKLATKPQ